MHSLDPVEFSTPAGFAPELIEQGGDEYADWTNSTADEFSAPDRSDDDDRSVEVGLSSFDAGIDYRGQAVDRGGDDFNYTNTVEGSSQGINLDAQSFAGADFNPSLDLYPHSHVETPSFESHLSTTDFCSESIDPMNAASLGATTPASSSFDDGAAVDPQSWAKHDDLQAESWTNDSSFAS